MTVSQPALLWRITPQRAFTVAKFEIASKDGILRHERLAEIGLPEAVRGKQDKGLILSGQGPVWLYAHLVHLAHTFAWVGVYDPRYRGAVVVQRHVPQSPELGEIVSYELIDANGPDGAETPPAAQKD